MRSGSAGAVGQIQQPDAGGTEVPAEIVERAGGGGVPRLAQPLVQKNLRGVCLERRRRPEHVVDPRGSDRTRRYAARRRREASARQELPARGGSGGRVPCVGSLASNAMVCTPAGTVPWSQSCSSGWKWIQPSGRASQSELSSGSTSAPTTRGSSLAGRADRRAPATAGTAGSRCRTAVGEAHVHPVERRGDRGDPAEVADDRAIFRPPVAAGGLGAGGPGRGGEHQRESKRTHRGKSTRRHADGAEPHTACGASSSSSTGGRGSAGARRWRSHSRQRSGSAATRSIGLRRARGAAAGGDVRGAAERLRAERRGDRRGRAPARARCRRGRSARPRCRRWRAPGCRPPP